MAGDAPPVTRPTWSPWRTVLGFGVVSLAADMVYEGARSVTGPLLASLGASAVLVGLVTGAGEAVALVLRLVFGPLADRSGRHWQLTFAGYAMTALSVPLLAVTPFVGAAGLALGATLVLLERTGKAVRSPSKSALLARVARTLGRGRGFAVHKALDQVGAFAGPLLVAAVVALTGHLWLALAVLGLPGVASLVLLAQVQRRGPADPPPDPAARSSLLRSGLGADLPSGFLRFAGSSAATTAGLVTFGVLSYHLTVDHVLPVATVPVVYAFAMAAAGLAALASGLAYDRVGPRVLYLLPVLVVAVPVIGFSQRATYAVLGVLVWGAAVGLQDSTVKALVADLVPSDRHATAYGVFAAVQGLAAVVGGAAAGALYEHSIPALVAVVVVTQVVAVALLALTLRRSPAVLP